MEKKRKLPARAAARVEHIAKKRTATPPDHRSATPASVQTPVPEEEQPPPQLLPRSVQPGKPLPTVEDAQPDDLPSKEYQSLHESGVLQEALSRSRHRWISEGIFEKYWSKPSKRKGVVIEEPNNPPKDSMTKLGQVTITIEPHVFEATMFAVKDPKPPPATPAFRPIIQYGPSNGAMPPPPTPSSQASTPAPPTSGPHVQAPTPTPAATQPLPQPQVPVPQPPPQATTITAPQHPATVPPTAIPSPNASDSTLPLNTAALQPSQPPQRPPSLPPSIPLQTSHPSPSPGPAPVVPAAPVAPVAASSAMPVRSPGAMNMPATISTVHGSMATPPARQAQPAGTDPIIVTLAERATEDPHLRDLMKRVASGNAPKEELERFQAIIDQITLESKRKGVVQGPSADRLFVEHGRTVRYFADEVKTILDIVLTTNPKQTSANLHPPTGSDPLVVLLVKTALDDVKTRDMVRRIAENRPLFSDATDLKATLDRLKSKLARGEQVQKTLPPSPSAVNGTLKPSGPMNGQPSPSPQAPPQQALRSKGPPPPLKPDISAIVMEFSGGSGDRYLFPKFSILEYVPSPVGQQVIASFLIVRKGSTFEYGGDPALDYYQPVTIRLWSPTGKYLESLTRVVAPPDEVRRYMDDVMDHMTRAEYILLAMRLPKGDNESKEDGQAPEKEKEKEEETNSTTPEAEEQSQWQRRSGVLWKSDKMPTKVPLRLPSLKDRGQSTSYEDDQYQSFVASVSRREPEEV